MIESAAYDIIKQEGIKEGFQGGMVRDAREMLIEVLKAKFKMVPKDLVYKINQMDDRGQLKKLVRQAVVCDSVEVFMEKCS